MQYAQDPLAVTSLSLPKGGGNIQGMGESLGAVGPDGLAHLSLPLPVSAGRGMSPTLNLTYSSAGGNDAFGLGWQVGIMSIRVRTQRGTPAFDGTDEFIGPDNELLVLAPNFPPRETDTVQGVKLDCRHRVTTWQSRTGTGTTRLEFWSPLNSASAQPFWLCYSPDGQVHCLGQRADARLFEPAHPSHIAEWFLQESVSPTGEHISYHYVAENEAGISASERVSHPGASARRYLQQVRYGNRTPQAHLYAWDATPPLPSHWLFTLVLDYGERDAALATVPDLQTSSEWSLRADPFSRYEYGFEVRTRRLCHQVLMFHDLDGLAGKMEWRPELVARLQLHYHQGTTVTHLVSCRLLGHEPDGSPCAHPPLSFDYQKFEPQTTGSWHTMNEGTLEDGVHYQLADLHGEGMPGILYQDNYGWQYRAPERASGSADGISYGSPVLLPSLPTLMEGGRLMDINGDGRLDWLVIRPELSGYYTRHPDQSWEGFTLLSTLPAEFWRDDLQFVDINGSGLADLVLIGPKSVRIYPNNRDGFSPASDVLQNNDVTLPLFGKDDRELVAFSDITGSGQVHLIRIRHDGVTCWPNLGRGRFASPQTLPGFSLPENEFDPACVYLADLDGSGATDLIYVRPDSLHIYMNESGNRFAPPLSLPLPEGVTYDATCRLLIGDFQGLGVSSLMLFCPHMTPRYWRYDLVRHKPYLLSRINNNRGADTHWSYRSSTQFWLDEKEESEQKGTSAVCELPFPVHLLAGVEALDEISGCRWRQNVTYRHGVYDGREREFRGFAMVETWDTDEQAQGTAAERSAPVHTRSWFHMGRAGDEQRYRSEYWSEDSQAGIPGSTRLTDFASQQDIELNADSETAFWLHRALKGQILRNEVFGEDGSAQQNTPYNVSETRYQARCVHTEAQTGQSPVVVGFPLEQWQYQYERVAEDPLVTQLVTLDRDMFGFPLHTVAINYPRRAKLTKCPYHLVLPDGAWSATYDPQQDVFHLADSRTSYHHLKASDAWVLGLPFCHREDRITLDTLDTLPYATILTAEMLSDPVSPFNSLRPKARRQYHGHSTVYYTTELAEQTLDKPTPQALVAYTETAVLDTRNVPDLTPDVLRQAGYMATRPAFARDDEADVWVVRHGLTDYGTFHQFYRPVRQRASLLTGSIELTWDDCYCAVTSTLDAAGNRTHAKYDYRFLQPTMLTDINDNGSSVERDALGRVTSTRIGGLKAGIRVGCPHPADVPFKAPSSVKEAVKCTELLPVSQYLVYDTHAWMPRIAPDNLVKARAERSEITEDGYVTALSTICREKEPRQPPHTLTVTTDRYYPDPMQQQQQLIVHLDGAGRVLQSAQRVPPQENEHATATGQYERWAVSGRTEYDNKGLPVRRYQPYFTDSWRYVTRDTPDTEQFADSHFYDALGREVRVDTAAGYQRRTHYTPWFTVSEDENDTLLPPSQSVS